MDYKKDIKNLDYYLAQRYNYCLNQDAEGDWVIFILELNGCISHGRTQAEALTSLEEVKKLWLESALEAGSTIPEPFGDDYVLRLWRKAADL